MGCAFQVALFNILVLQVCGHCLFDNQPKLQSCGRRCLGVPGGGKVTCVSNCLVGKGVSWSCASCLGRGFNCGVNSCMGSCSTGFSKPSCTTCISSQCGLCSRARSGEDVAENATLEALMHVFAGAATAGSSPELQEEASTRSGSGCFEVQALMKTCGTRCYSSSNQATCAAGCLTGKGVSPGCASCFGRKISCTIKRCLSGCAADPNGAACTSCVASKCGRCNAAKSLDEPVDKDSFVAALVELASHQPDQNTVDNTTELEEEASTRSGSGCFEVQALMKTCGTRCYSSSNQTTCAAGCLTGKGVSPGCASCFGRKISCTIKRCLSGCAADPNGAACTSCVASKCGRCNAAKSLDEPVDKDSFVAALVELASHQPDQNTVDSTTKLEEEASTRSGSGCFEVQALMKTCGTRCYSSSNQATCAAGCLTGKGVSPGCASCFGRKISCTIKRCLSGCAADPNGAACTSCVASKCGRCNAAKSLEEPVDKDSFVAALVELASHQPDQNTVDNTTELEEEASTRSGSGCFEVQALMKTCGTRCYSSSNQATCAAGCLTGKGVSPGCASCFGRKISCTIKRCLSGCAADPNGAACTSCVASKCGRCNAAKSLDEPVDKDSFVAALVELASHLPDQNTIFP